MYIGRAVRAGDEQTWPMTATIFLSIANLEATPPASLGSHLSSPQTASNFIPLTPPAAFISSIFIVTPVLMLAPKAAAPPVNGPATPILIVSAQAGALPKINASINSPKIMN